MARRRLCSHTCDPTSRVAAESKAPNSKSYHLRCCACARARGCSVDQGVKQSAHVEQGREPERGDDGSAPLLYSGVPSERLSRRQDSTLTTGHLASYGTASSRCSPMLACRSSRSPAWLGTAGPQPPRRSTGSRFGRSSCTVPTSWTKSSQGGRLRMLSYSFSYSASVMARIHFGLHAL